MNLYGKVISVETRNLGEPAVADAAIGATTIYVNDAATFDEQGGAVVIGGVQLAYVGIDVDNDILTLADPLTVAVADQDPIEVYPPTPVKTALVSLGEDGDPLPVTVPHSLLDKFADGTRSDETAESVTVEQRGTYEFVLSDAIGEQLTQQSLDFLPSDQGYGLSEAGAQIQNLSVLGSMGADAGSFASLQVAGQDLGTQLSMIPGAAKYALKGAAGNIKAGYVNSTTERRLFTFNAGPILAGHVYDVGIRGLGATTVAGDTFWIYLRYTTDGSEPTTTSPRIDGGQIITAPAPASNLVSIFASTFYAAPADGLLKISVSAARIGASSGTLAIFTEAPEAAFQVWCQDRGVDVDSSTALQQTLKIDGSGSDNPPITTFVKTFDATWGQSYSPGGDPYTTLSNSDTLWVGYDSTWGPAVAGIDDPDMSLIGFNYTAIMSALSASTTMQKCEVLFRGRWRKVSSGLDVKFMTHDYSSFPGVIDPYNITGSPNTHLTFLANAALNIAPSVNYAVDLGATIGNQFKAGTRRGVGIIGQDLGDDSRGYIYGLGATYKPKLRFTYLGTA